MNGEKVVVICINGTAYAGKDTFAQLVLDCDGISGKVVSTIDPVKKLYTEFFGWDGKKTQEHRKNLNIIKNIWREVSNGPVEWTREEVQKAYNKGYNVLFVMVREFEEMMKTVALCDELDTPVITLNVVRPGIDIPPIEQEFLDSHPEEYEYDITVLNPTVADFPNVPILQGQAEIVSRIIRRISTQVGGLICR